MSLDHFLFQISKVLIYISAQQQRSHKLEGQLRSYLYYLLIQQKPREFEGRLEAKGRLRYNAAMFLQLLANWSLTNGLLYLDAGIPLLADLIFPLALPLLCQVTER